MVTPVSRYPLAAIAAAAMALPLATSAADIRVMCYQDGIECDVTAELVTRGSAIAAAAMAASG